MKISRNFVRNLKLVVTGFAILGTGALQATGQPNPLPQTIPTNIRDNASGNVELEKGRAAFSSGKLDEAIHHFKDAISLNPKDPVAKLWLGEALTRKVTPGVETPENLKTAQQAIDLYQEVISEPLHPSTEPMPWNEGEQTVKAEVMKRIALINFNIDRLDESKAWQKRVLAEEPKNAEASFAVAVIDWMQAHQNALAALKAAGLTDDGQGNAKAPAAVMAAIKTQNRALIGEALVYLNRVIENRPDYGDAMAYLALIYKQKADLDFGNESARLDDVAKAHEWMHKATVTRKANEAKKSAGSDSAHL
jgi:tetratricopeptide (TPR) repeat protein